MSALAWFLEDEGIATTGISLVREHTEKMGPPRFLWVPFVLGRPLGVPGDADFQHDVIAQALALLDAQSGPVLADYPRDAPVDAPGDEPDASESWVCPVRFAQAGNNNDDLPSAVRDELRELAPWHELAVRQRGRTTARASGLEIMDALDLVAGALDTPPEDVRTFKYATEDLKAFYLEAASTTPGASSSMNTWLWRETRLTELLRALATRHAKSDDPALAELIKSGFVPREFS